jgi:hypothetical protein
VRVEESQWQISNKTNSNAVSPTLKINNGLKPNNSFNEVCSPEILLIHVLIY